MPSIHLVIYFLIYCQLSEGIVSIKQEDCVEAFKPVMIEDTAYSLVNLPGSETQVVVDERRKILHHIDLGSLQQKLGHVGRCIQLVKYGMVAASSSKLQIEVERLGNDLTRLWSKSANAVSNFKRESTEILTDLQATYEYLVAGSEEMALETLSSVSNIAGKFALVAEELHNCFDEKAQKVQQIVENTQETEADARQTEEDKRDREKMQEFKTQEYKKAKEEKEKADQSYFNSVLEEAKAIENLTYEEEGCFLLKIIGFFSYSEQSQKRVKKYEDLHQKKMDAREIQMENEEREEQASQSVIESIVELHSYESKVKSAKSSVEALHRAMEGLKPLKTTMIKAADFWKKIQEHCKALSDSKLKDKVASKMHEHSDEQRLKLWISTPFKKKLVNFNAGWVALNGILDEYMGSIMETQDELYKYIEESPSQEEASHSLAAKFWKDLQNAEKACAKEDSECRS